MSSSNLGSKLGFNLNDWLLPTPSAIIKKTSNDTRLIAVGQAEEVRADMSEDEDNDDDCHSTNNQPTPTHRSRTRAESTRSEDGSFTFYTTLDRNQGKKRGSSTP